MHQFLMSNECPLLSEVVLEELKKMGLRLFLLFFQETQKPWSMLAASPTRSVYSWYLVVRGVRKVLALFRISETNATGSDLDNWIKQWLGITLPHPSANCSLCVNAICGDDAGAETLAFLDDEGRLRSLPRCHDTSLQRLKCRVRGGLDY